MTCIINITNEIEDLEAVLSETEDTVLEMRLADLKRELAYMEEMVYEAHGW